MNDIGGWGFAASAILVVVAIAISAWQSLGLERSLAWAAVRALVQLAAMGAVLVVLLEPSAPLWWSWLWVLVMIGFAARTLYARIYHKSDSASEPRSRTAVAVISVAAFTCSVAATLGVLFVFDVFAMEPRTVVPLSGMVIGNSMNASVLVARRILAEFSDRAPEVEARLALGYASQDAAKPYLREAIRTALIPQIETTKAVGIVFLPGAMVGLILAGADPADAIRVQLAVMYLVLGSVAITTSIIALGLSRQVFTTDQRLILTRRSPQAPPR